MKLLCMSDMHDQYSSYRFSVDEMPDADVVLIAGDFTNFGMRRPEEVDRAKRWMHRLARRYRRIAYVLGNHDIQVSLDAFAGDQYPPMEDGTLPMVKSLSIPGPFEYSSPIRYIDGTSYVGINLSPCFASPDLKREWSNMTDDPAVDAAAFDSLPAARIVVSHCPPLGWLDNAGYVLAGPGQGWAHIGSPGLLAYIKRHKPALVVCGHVHEAAGSAEFEHEDGSVTAIYNVARTWRLIEMDDTII